MCNLDELLGKLIKLKVLEVSAGKTTGSIILIHFGHKNHDYSLMVYSAWRLDDSRSKKPVTGNNESNNPKTGVMIPEIKKLLGNTITDVDNNEFGDLVLCFDTGKILRIFCDITPNVDNDYVDVNWVFYNIKKNKCYTFDKRFEVILSSCDEP